MLLNTPEVTEKNALGISRKAIARMIEERPERYSLRFLTDIAMQRKTRSETALEKDEWLASFVKICDRHALEEGKEYLRQLGIEE